MIREHPDPGCRCGDDRCLMHLPLPWDDCDERCWETARLRHAGRARYLIRRAA